MAVASAPVSMPLLLAPVVAWALGAPIRATPDDPSADPKPRAPHYSASTSTSRYLSAPPVLKMTTDSSLLIEPLSRSCLTA